MANQKLETLLNISLDVTEQEREKSPDLNAGVNEEEDTWELIVKYIDSISELKDKYPGIVVYELLNQYAVVITPKRYIEYISREKQVEFIEKPKLLYFELLSEKAASCITQLQQGADNPYNLYGEGVIVAVIDTGIDVMLPEFQNPDKTTRILNIWEQDSDAEYDSDDINSYILNPQGKQAPGFDYNGHGTQVARIACGNNGVAPKSGIIAVKMGTSGRNAFPRTTQLMRAVDYCIKKAAAYNMPVAVNISFGNNYGDHTGTSIQETFINSAAAAWKTCVCVGSGNEGLGAVHTSGVLKNDEEYAVELAVSTYETSLNIQIWKDYWDDFDVEIINPAGRNLGRISRYNTVNRASADGTEVLTYYGQPMPFSVRQEIYIDMIPERNYILSGIWVIRLIPNRIRTGRFDMWLPSINATNQGTGFTRPDSNVTLTVPSTAPNVITVGSYNAALGNPSPFSGRGYVISVGSAVTSKPDLVAPGENVRLDERTVVTGTSFATPFVTGSAALLMEWGCGVI